MIISKQLKISMFIVMLAMLITSAFAEVSEKDALGVMEATQTGLRNIHNKISPAVVSITTQIKTKATTQADPFENFFNPFGGPQPNQQPRIQVASGSGVIIQSEGIVLTNRHVVQDATKVTVQLNGSDKQLAAEVIQTDTRTDLAIVKITEKGTYPTAKLGDASKVQPGDWSIAFGSPFRLYSTMTVGHISAIGRKLSAPSDDFNFRDLLQTDAAINPGNSGGPLVNINSEIIGINFMIFSPTGDVGGNVGIGFAIPINASTKNIINSLIIGKQFERGRLGIMIKDLDDPSKEAYGVTSGVFVDSVLPGQAAEKSGLKSEDIITMFGDTKITDADQFVGLVEQTTPGSKISVTYIRNRKEDKLTVTVGSLTTAEAKAKINSTNLGMTVKTITADLAKRFQLTEGNGVIVATVEPGTPVDDAGLRQGDIVLRIGVGDKAKQITSEETFWTAINEAMASAKKGVIVQIRRGQFIMTRSIPVVTAD
jgi:serine protease Do